MKGLDPAKIQSLLSKPKQTKTRRPKGKVDTNERIYSTWFAIPHVFGHCSNPECSDTRPALTEDGKTMVSEIDGKPMCRLCFLEGYGLTTDE